MARRDDRYSSAAVCAEEGVRQPQHLHVARSRPGTRAPHMLLERQGKRLCTCELFGEHFVLVGVTVALSLVWIVMWGATAGAMLPFALRRLGFDPASASAPFVATLVDVTGLVIYFSVATVVLSGTLL